MGESREKKISYINKDNKEKESQKENKMKEQGLKVETYEEAKEQEFDIAEISSPSGRKKIEDRIGTVVNTTDETSNRVHCGAYH